MADISMCTDKKCPMKVSCYRYTAPWNQWRQTVFAESPRKGEDCDHFWNNEGYRLHKDFKQKEDEKLSN